MSEELKDLIEQKIGNLQGAEKEFFQAVIENRPADFSVNVQEKDDPAQAKKWGKERVLEAKLIVDFLRDPLAMSRVPHKGIEVRGARIDGDLDLRAIKIPFPFIFKKCAFTGDVILTNCKICMLDLSGSHVCSIDCTDSEVDKGIFLSDGFKSNGIVCIERATIGGFLDCTGGNFINPEKQRTSLDADGIKVASDVLLHNGFRAEGMVSLVEARIKGNLECNQGVFVNRDEVAINAERLKVNGDVYLCKGYWGKGKEKQAEGFRAEGEVKLVGARIGGTLECRGGIFKHSNSEEPALNANGLKVDGNMLLRNGFRAEGMVSLLGGRIKGNLECNQGEFINNGKVAINAERLKVDGDVYLCKGTWGRDKGVQEKVFSADGEVKFVGAEIGGTLECRGGTFKHSHPEEPALNAKGLKVGGSVLLRNGFIAEGMVSLVGTTIKNNLECNEGVFINKGKVAINAERLKVEGDVYLCKGTWGRDKGVHEKVFSAEGEVKLVGAEIGGTLECRGGVFANSDSRDPALNAKSLKVGGNILLHNGFRAEGMVSLLGAIITGNFECKKGEFTNKGKVALDAERIKVGGDVFLCEGSWGEGENIKAKGFACEGEVRLVRAVITGDLNCIGGKFCNPEEKDTRGEDKKEPKYALKANGLNINGGIFLSEGFQAYGRVDLVDATIGGNLECNSGEFINKGDVALDAERLKVDGDVLLCEGCRRAKNPIADGRFKAIGNVKLIGATVGGTVKCNGASFANTEPGISSEINLYGATINRELVWSKIDSPKQAELDLRFASVVKLSDEKNSWPGAGNLLLNGLVYDEIGTDQKPQAGVRWFGWRYFWRFLVTFWKQFVVSLHGNIEVKNRIDWLRLQGEFHHQPYEQLVSVLRKNGRDSDARTVLVAKAKDRAKLMSFFGRFWHWFLGVTIGYGYRPWRALCLSAFVVAFGTVIFWIGHKEKIIKETKVVEYVSVAGRDPNVIPVVQEYYPEFNALVYSLDMFVPLVDLRQATYWLPSADPNAGPSADPNAGPSADPNTKPRSKTRAKTSVDPDTDPNYKQDAKPITNPISDPNDKPSKKKDGEPDGSQKVTISVGLMRFYTWIHIILGWILTTLLIAGLSGLVKR